MSALFTPVQVGRYTLANRMVMAPMTRSRADDAGVPSELAVTYYAQRATAGLIISEGVFPTAMGKGYVNTPGIETEAQVATWKLVTEAVHAAGGKIAMQILHFGRYAYHPELVAPSALKAPISAFRPHALTGDEVSQTIEDYANAAALAQSAGYDGVEIMGSEGYLINEFIARQTNQRDDEWGGAYENRIRFALEIVRRTRARDRKSVV